METIPKHLKIPKRHVSHCCFSGCTPRDCGCCVNMPFHEADCSNNPAKMLDDAMHDAYVAGGNRQHLKG